MQPADGSDAGRDVQRLEALPHRIVDGMVGIAPLEERRPDDDGAEAALRDALELAHGEGRRLERKDRRGHEAASVRGRELVQPVVVGACERPGDVRVLDQREVLAEERGKEQRAIDAHRVHVGEARDRIGRTRGGVVLHVGIERTDRVRRHARPPARLAVDPAAAQRARRPAVQERGLDPVRVDVVPERAARREAVLAIEEAVPHRRGLVHVALHVDDHGAFLSRVAAPASAGAGRASRARSW